MTARRSPRPDTIRSVRGWVCALALTSSSLALGAPLLQESGPEGVGERSVSAAAQPCLNVRTKPSYRALPTACLEAGTRVTVSVVSGGWSQISAPGDVSGWVGTRFLVDEGSDSGRETAAIAPAPESGPAGTEVDHRLADAAIKIAALEAELTERVRALTAERDSLARELARTEAQVLYLMADLEKTRAELMRLKGIPPKLVIPEPEPEPAPPAVEPEPEEPAEELPISPEAIALEEVVGTVLAWARAWSEQRVDDYLAFYSDAFRPPGGEGLESWAALRRERLAAPSSIQVTLDQIVPVVRGDRAGVTFVQSYTSDTFSDSVSKTLVLERAASGDWQIVEERVE